MAEWGLTVSNSKSIAVKQVANGFVLTNSKNEVYVFLDIQSLLKFIKAEFREDGDQ